MNDRPITPSRIIPAGAPLPDRGPLPGEIPPWWRTPAPAAAAPPVPPPPPITTVPPPAPAPAPLPPQMHVHVVMAYEPAPEPTRRQRLWAWIRTIGKPWQICGALALAVLPIPGVGYSLATIWAYGVSETRETWGQGAGYALACTPLVITAIRTTSNGGNLGRLLLLAVSLVGLTGAINLYDPVTWITGVRP